MYRGCCGGCGVGGATVWVSVTGGGVETSVVTTVVV